METQGKVLGICVDGFCNPNTTSTYEIVTIFFLANALLDFIIASLTSVPAANWLGSSRSKATHAKAFIYSAFPNWETGKFRLRPFPLFFPECECSCRQACNLGVKCLINWGSHDWQLAGNRFIALGKFRCWSRSPIGHNCRSPSRSRSRASVLLPKISGSTGQTGQSVRQSPGRVNTCLPSDTKFSLSNITFAATVFGINIILWTFSNELGLMAPILAAGSPFLCQC